MKNDDLETALTTIDIARRILGEYIEPGPRDATSTVNRLLATFDDRNVVKALDDLRRRRTIRLMHRRSQPL